jgi:LPS sulfotransferase NodH
MLRFRVREPLAMPSGASLPAPIFITGCARSGTTLLFSLLSSASSLWSSYSEEHGIYEWDIGLHPDLLAGESNVLESAACTQERVARIHTYLWHRVANPELFGISHLHKNRLIRRAAFGMSRQWKRLMRKPVRVVEKNPKHVYRLPFLRAVFPDAKFIFLVRDGRSNIASLIEGWESGRFRTYRLPRPGGRETLQWSFELPPDWQAWRERPMIEQCAFQWVAANEYVTRATKQLPPTHGMVVSYERLIVSPLAEMERICQFLGVEMDPAMRRLCAAPPELNFLTRPHQDKWRNRASELAKVDHVIRPMMRTLGYD